MVGGLPETDLVCVRRWCEQRIPAHAQHQVRLEHQTRGHTVTIVERKAPGNPNTARSGPHDQSRNCANGWRLYWPDRNTRWHVIHDMPAAQNVTPLLEVIDDPGRPPFLG
jgi:hypothetical protein